MMRAIRASSPSTTTHQTRGRDNFHRAKPLLLIGSRALGLMSLKAQNQLWLVARPIPGTLGLALRWMLLNNLPPNCGDNVSIHPNVYLFGLSNLTLGNNVSIHPISYLDATGGLTIGSDVSIAHAVTVMTTSHHFSRTDVPIKDQGLEKRPTAIADDVWLGAKVTILAGVNIGRGCVIGANSVVTKPLPPFPVAVGVPARRIKARYDEPDKDSKK